MKLVKTNDADLIATLNRPIHERHVALMPHFFASYDYERVRKAFAETINRAGHHFLVAEVSEEPVGYIWMQEVTSASNAFKNATRTLYVRQISINPSHQRFGYGRQMMGYVEKWARAHDFPTIELDYWVANEDAAHFYDELGFIAKRQVVVKSVETKENEKWRP
ncbi:GNAT family N-acetyltransferase [Exiguobacterium sp. s150]|uniref:GNAT family N-acetyltransferase n=1 Tax=Exiguobacterium sp. s150 TaxID=2751221 RepID=UPI001BE74AAC|nr:GNAT family N-acetyltransferase [Exiguobacterium sp. s150]